MRTPAMLAVLAALTVLGAAPAAAQGYSGSWSIPGGNAPITITLREQQGQITGTLTGQATFQIQARINGQMFEGLATSAQGRIYIAGQVAGPDALTVVLGEVDASGTPNQQTMRSFTATRSAGAAVAAAGGKPGAGQAGGNQGGGRPGAGEAGQAGGGSSAIAPTAADQQVAQLLLRSAWCYFSYSQTSGTTRTERNVYRADGTGAQSSGAETYNSGRNGTVSGQSAGGTPFRWRIQNQMLLVSTDGVTWSQPIVLQVTQNSNGYPIITALGREYSMCN